MKRIFVVISIVLFYMILFTNFSNAANIGFNGIGGKVGLVMSDGFAHNNLGVGVLIDLGTIIPNLKLEGCADYWKDSWVDPLTTMEYSYSIINIGPTVKYHFPVGNFKAFAGGGVVLSMYDIEDTEIDIPIVFGITTPIGPSMDFIVEARYLLIHPDAEAFWISGGIIVEFK